MPDRHKIQPKAVRMPGGLLAWYAEIAATEGRPVNAVIVGALEEYRARHGGATPTGGATAGTTTQADGATTTAPVNGATTARGTTTARPKRERKTATTPPPPVAAGPPAGLTVASALPRPKQSPCPHRAPRGSWCKLCQAKA